MLQYSGVFNFPSSCPANFTPDTVSIKSGFYSGTGEGVIDTWKDGAIGRTGTFSCQRGSKEGENVNYWYCKNAAYEKKIINQDGTIGKDTKLYVDLIIDSSSSTVIGSACRACQSAQFPYMC